MRFKEITIGHVIIMGRKTHESIGRALPGRTTIVISRTPSPVEPTSFRSVQDAGLLWASGRENALYLADLISIGKEKSDFFVIGGGEIFEMFVDLFHKVYLTEVLADVRGDAVFDFEFRYPFWQKTLEKQIPQSDHDEYPSRFFIYEKRDKTTRFRILPDFLTDSGLRREWIRQNVNRISMQRRPETEDSLSLFPDTPT